jgi:hypothetical protein
LSSSELRRLSAEVDVLGEALSAGGGEPADVDQGEIAALLAAASRLFANSSPEPYGAASLAALELTPTEACTVAAAMLRSQSLTPFEFSIWFSGARVGGGDAR